MAAQEVPGPQGPAVGLLELARQVARADVDGLSDAGVEGELAALEQVRRLTEARQCRLADVLRRRQAERLRARGTDRTRAEREAERDTQRRLTDGLQWTPSDARRASRLGRQLRWSPRSARQFDAGRLSPRHAQVLADTLAHLEGAERERAEARLLEQAAEQDAVTFGRTCRRLLAELDHDAAMAAQQRRHARRYARMAQTPDGMLAVSAQLAGLDAEEYATALQAFRRPTAADESRTPEQATADAMVEMARAALRAGEASTRHGVRPHVVAGIDYQDLLRDAGVAETVWMGPLPVGEIRPLLSDCGVSRLLIEPEGLPVEAGPEVRTVPAGLFRGLHVRDGGCIATGCDAPAAWCDVMHLDTPYRFQGRLSLDNAALGCRTHHRRFDQEGWSVTWRDRRPTLHPPGRPPPTSDPPSTQPPRAGPSR